MTELRQTTLTANMTLNDKVKLCHSRIPQARHIEGFLDFDLIAPLPIWSPVPEKYRKSAHDSFSVWGLEAQHPKYLPEVLKPFVQIQKRGKNENIWLLEGAYKHREVFSFKGEANSKDLAAFHRARLGHYDEHTDVLTIYLDQMTKAMIDDFGHIIGIPEVWHNGEQMNLVTGQNIDSLADVFSSVVTHEYIHRALWQLGEKDACSKYDHHAFYENVECEEVRCPE